MAWKDASQQHFKPVDQHQKQIGKPDWKKSHKDVKAMKIGADRSPQLSAQKIVFMIGVSITLHSLVYTYLFWCSGIASLDEVTVTPPLW